MKIGALIALWLFTLYEGYVIAVFWGIIRLAGKDYWPTIYLPRWLTRNRLYLLSFLEILLLLTCLILTGWILELGVFWRVLVVLFSLQAYFLIKHFITRLELKRWLKAHPRYQEWDAAEDFLP